ncbi:MAG: RNA-binding protein [Gammaproteobacteria bacterium SG8_47]|nr:MAG: RNA-binding protein [Gammaproteobacteria bacterium SG8_47]
MKTMYVGNLAPDTTEEDVRALFSQYGTVRNIKLSTDIFTGKCRGFGLVDMEGHEARAAMASLNGTLFKGKGLRVNEEKPRFKRGGGRRR